MLLRSGFRGHAEETLSASSSGRPVADPYAALLDDDFTAVEIDGKGPHDKKAAWPMSHS
jgi:hypothetical protein